MQKLKKERRGKDNGKNYFCNFDAGGHGLFFWS
jgi:hypothetical protein